MDITDDTEWNNQVTMWWGLGLVGLCCDIVNLTVIIIARRQLSDVSMVRLY